MNNINISSALKLAVVAGFLAVSLLTQSFAQPSASDLIAGEITQISAERGTVTVRHAAIAHLHLPATITDFHYVDPKLILRIKEGDRVRFRVDRYEGTLRLTAVFPG